jgi:hypothetical protein
LQPHHLLVCALPNYIDLVRQHLFHIKIFCLASWRIDKPRWQTPSPYNVYATKLHWSSYVAPSFFTSKSIPCCKITKEQTTTAKPTAFWRVHYQVILIWCCYTFLLHVEIKKLPLQINEEKNYKCRPHYLLVCALAI